ncbi:LOB domain-containing protein 23-like [Henckelia pumila]|uniref:LOB domain-containing protein 23-like n=1 Tax=Henckelia pumila TaxID=405737 RepID=UPI003C6DD559
MTLKGTDSTPNYCAACKFRRRKCSATCPLAPYFPANKPETFGYVHRLYGVSHITKILETLETKKKRDDAMRSIIYESKMRALIPVYGCSFVIESLRSRLVAAQYELSCKRALIAALKSLQSDETVDHNSPSSQKEAQLPENVAGPVPGLDLPSDVRDRAITLNIEEACVSRHA